MLNAYVLAKDVGQLYIVNAGEKSDPINKAMQTRWLRFDWVVSDWEAVLWEGLQS